MAVYKVKRLADGVERLIETRTKAGAINHVSASDYTAKSLNTSELVQSLKSGLQVETLTAEAEEKFGKTPIEKVIEEKKQEASVPDASPAPASAKAAVMQGVAPAAKAS